jgi:hypothetical protein
MSFSTLPQAMAIALQQSYLQKEFQTPLLSNLKYRLLAERIVFPGRIGDTITQTRVGLMTPNLVPLNPSTNTNLDNGLTAQNYTSEQYTLAIQQYPQLAPDINLIDNETTIKSFLMKNSYNLGFAQSQVTERLTRNALFGAYLSGNTFVTATLGSAGPTIHVDDIRGFQSSVVAGVVTPVSPTNPIVTSINGNNYNIQSFAADVTNVSTSAITGGISGTITASANILVADGTAGNYVISSVAPTILRPNGRTTSAGLISSDTLSMTVLQSAVSILRSNGVPAMDGKYNIYLSPASQVQLFNDPSFQILNRGVGVTETIYKNLAVSEFLDMRFIQTTEAFIQPVATDGSVSTQVTIQRPIVAGAECVVEGHFEAGEDAILEMGRETGFTDFIEGRSSSGIVAGYEDIFMHMRGPLDRLGQIVSMTSNWIGGYTVPTDVGTTSAVIPTANNAMYKRAVVIETAS